LLSPDGKRCWLLLPLARGPDGAIYVPLALDAFLQARLRFFRDGEFLGKNPFFGSPMASGSAFSADGKLKKIRHRAARPSPPPFAMLPNDTRPEAWGETAQSCFTPDVPIFPGPKFSSRENSRTA